MSVKLEREAKEKLHCDVESLEDPAAYTVFFAFTDRTDTTARPGGTGAAAWTAGTWYAPATGDVATGFTRVAVTPLIGDGTLDLAVGKWKCWSRVVGGAEEAVDMVDTVVVA